MGTYRTTILEKTVRYRVKPKLQTAAQIYCEATMHRTFTEQEADKFFVEIEKLGLEAVVKATREGKVR